MGLIFLGGPSVPNPVGQVVKIVNAKQPSANALHWTFENVQGAFTASRRYTNTLHVITNSPFVGPLQVRDAILGTGGVQGATYRFPLPELNGSGGPSVPTEIDTGSFCQSIEIVQQAEDGMQYLVTLQYSPFDVGHELGNSQVQNGSVNPIEMAPEVHWSSAKYEVNYPMDVNGIPFTNTAGDPFDPPPKTEETRQVLMFVRNDQQYVEAWAQQYRDSVNADVFLGYQPNQVKCRDIQGKRIYTADYGYYWQVSYEFEFRIGTTVTVTAAEGGIDAIAGAGSAPATVTTGWYANINNTGLRQLVGGMGTPQQITIDGALITSPVCLQQDGSYAPGSDPYFVQFVLYPAQIFANLNIPNDVLTQSQ